MNVFELLKQDHQRVRDLMSDMERVDKGQRSPVFDRLRHELIVHAHAEKNAFYDPLKTAQQTHNDVADGLDEHQHIEEMLDRMAAMDSASDDFLREARSLRDCVEHHVQEEEQKMFVHARQVIPDDRLDAWGDRMAQAKQEEERRTP